jgi:NAD(P)-dependent dehydrogenase (short-subunit alcohol dehydrogenase family)
MASWSGPPDLAGRTAIVTGATNGIGLEAAAALARAGARVTLTGRSAARGAAALAEVRRRHGSAQVDYELADVSSLASVAAFAERWGGRPLDILLNNAGIIAPPARRETADGFELTIGTNFLGPFALTARLLPALLAAPAPRVVTIASIAHRRARIDFDDLQSRKSYSSGRVYGQSKLADLMFALELSRRAEAAGSKLLSLAAHPGLALTNIVSGMDSRVAELAFRVIGPFVAQSAALGALPGLYAATSPRARSGEYYGPDGFREFKGQPRLAEIRPQALDLAAARRLWAAAAALTGVEPAF